MRNQIQYVTRKKKMKCKRGVEREKERKRETGNDGKRKTNNKILDGFCVSYGISFARFMCSVILGGALQRTAAHNNSAGPSFFLFDFIFSLFSLVGAGLFTRI